MLLRISKHVEDLVRKIVEIFERSLGILYIKKEKCGVSRVYGIRSLDLIRCTTSLTILVEKN